MSSKSSKSLGLSAQEPLPELKTSTSKWTREIALKAIQLEEQYYAKHTANHELVIKFPDPPLSEEIVKAFSASIGSASFPSSILPRECIVKLNDGSNVDKTIKEISRIKFGGGKLQAEKKLADEQKLNLAPEEIDPFTLYFANLPHSKIPELKLIIKNGTVQVGQNKRKPKSYAFATFKTFEEAVKGFKKCTKKFPPSQFITIRFKRNKTNLTDDSLQEIEQNVSNPVEETPTAASTPNKDLSNENSTKKSKRKYQKREKAQKADKNKEQANSSNDGEITQNSAQSQSEQSKDGYDPNIKIKEEPDVGIRRVPYQDDMDGDTDCSNSTYRCRSNSVDSGGARKAHLSDDSILAITDSDDEPHEPKMKKPKLLVLPMVLHGSMREVKDEKNEASDDEIDDIGDLDFI